MAQVNTAHCMWHTGVVQQCGTLCLIAVARCVDHMASWTHQPDQHCCLWTAHSDACIKLCHPEVLPGGMVGDVQLTREDGPPLLAVAQRMSLPPHAGIGTVSTATNCSEKCQNKFDVLCAAKNKCWTNVGSLLGVVLGGLAGAGLLLLALKYGWLNSLFQCCSSGTGFSPFSCCGGSSSRSDTKEASKGGADSRRGGRGGRHSSTKAGDRHSARHSGSRQQRGGGSPISPSGSAASSSNADGSTFEEDLTAPAAAAVGKGGAALPASKQKQKHKGSSKHRRYDDTDSADEGAGQAAAAAAGELYGDNSSFGIGSGRRGSRGSNRTSASAGIGGMHRRSPQQSQAAVGNGVGLLPHDDASHTYHTPHTASGQGPLGVGPLGRQQSRGPRHNASTAGGYFGSPDSQAGSAYAEGQFGGSTWGSAAGNINSSSMQGSGAGGSMKRSAPVGLHRQQPWDDSAAGGGGGRFPLASVGGARLAAAGSNAARRLQSLAPGSSGGGLLGATERFSSAGAAGWPEAERPIRNKAGRWQPSFNDADMGD